MASWGDTLLQTTYIESSELIVDARGRFSMSGSLNGNYSIRVGTTGLSRDGMDVIPVGDIFLSTVDSTLPVEETTTYYKLRGYYSVDAAYEVWVSTDPDSSPPSGHTLDDIVIVSKWTV